MSTFNEIFDGNPVLTRSRNFHILETVYNNVLAAPTASNVSVVQGTGDQATDLIINYDYSGEAEGDTIIELLINSVAVETPHTVDLTDHGKSAFVRVTPRSQSGIQGAMVESSPITLDARVPATITDLADSNPTTGGFQLDWTNPNTNFPTTPGADDQVVQISLDSDPDWSTPIISEVIAFDDEQYIATGLNADTSYACRILARNVFAPGGIASNTTTADTDTPVSAPAGEPSVTVTPVGSTRLDVRLDAPVADAESYDIEIQPTAGGGFEVATTSWNGLAYFPLTTYSASPLVAETSYDIRVRARNTAGTGPYTDPVIAQATGAASEPDMFELMNGAEILGYDQNSADANTQLATFNRDIYFALLDENGKMEIRKQNLDTLVVESEIIEPTATVPADVHFIPSIGIDAQGYIHFKVAMHHSRNTGGAQEYQVYPNITWQYWISNKPQDISAFTFIGNGAVPPGGAVTIPNSNWISYPQYFRDRFGTLYLTYRSLAKNLTGFAQGKVGGSVARYNPATRAWTNLGAVAPGATVTHKQLFWTNHGHKQTAYQGYKINMVTDINNRRFFCVSANTDGSSTSGGQLNFEGMTDVLCAYTDDDVNFYAMDGTLLTLPINKDNNPSVSLVYETPSKTWTRTRMAVDSNGHPWIWFRNSVGAQYRRWNGSSWIGGSVPDVSMNNLLAIWYDDNDLFYWAANGKIYVSDDHGLTFTSYNLSDPAYDDAMKVDLGYVEDYDNPIILSTIDNSGQWKIQRANFNDPVIADPDTLASVDHVFSHLSGLTGDPYTSWAAAKGGITLTPATSTTKGTIAAISGTENAPEFSVDADKMTQDTHITLSSGFEAHYVIHTKTLGAANLVLHSDNVNDNAEDRMQFAIRWNPNGLGVMAYRRIQGGSFEIIGSAPMSLADDAVYVVSFKQDKVYLNFVELQLHTDYDTPITGGGRLLVLGGRPEIATAHPESVIALAVVSVAGMDIDDLKILKNYLYNRYLFEEITYP